MQQKEKLINHVAISLSKALNGQSKMDREVLEVKGFSTQTMRHLFSNLCNMEQIVYLEVGLFHGGTFTAACNRNHFGIHGPQTKQRFFGVENWSQDFGQGDIRSSFEISKQKFCHPWLTKIIEKDAFDCKEDLPTGVNVFFFDGNHSRESQRKAMSYFVDNLADVAIVLVDDFLWADVNFGTREGIEDSKDKYKIVAEWVLSDAPHDGKLWHNGLFIAVIEKL